MRVSEAKDANSAWNYRGILGEPRCAHASSVWCAHWHGAGREWEYPAYRRGYGEGPERSCADTLDGDQRERDFHVRRSTRRQIHDVTFTLEGIPQRQAKKCRCSVRCEGDRRTSRHAALIQVPGVRHQLALFRPPSQWLFRRLLRLRPTRRDWSSKLMLGRGIPFEQLQHLRHDCTDGAVSNPHVESVAHAFERRIVEREHKMPARLKNSSARCYFVGIRVRCVPRSDIPDWWAARATERGCAESCSGAVGKASRETPLTNAERAGRILSLPPTPLRIRPQTGRHRGSPRTGSLPGA